MFMESYQSLIFPASNREAENQFSTYPATRVSVQWLLADDQGGLVFEMSLKSNSL